MLQTAMQSIFDCYEKVLETPPNAFYKILRYIAIVQKSLSKLSKNTKKFVNLVIFEFLFIKR